MQVQARTHQRARTLMKVENMQVQWPMHAPIRELVLSCMSKTCSAEPGAVADARTLQRPRAIMKVERQATRKKLDAVAKERAHQRRFKWAPPIYSCVNAHARENPRTEHN
eukprot:CAMPEP_0117561640 /NCGR_PEP_ID=MMETSP0784-20121206/54527_1 /TAXON_ID=39447 /ORGANISM="" /LENGTH=109 /DNA_ID=CAMNT_0005359149 /DNA_START=212 /DNA_END=541 /DNA_ORIENTATION=-